jgi:hypothetical protein
MEWNCNYDVVEIEDWDKSGDADVIADKKNDKQWADEEWGWDYYDNADKESQKNAEGSTPSVIEPDNIVDEDDINNTLDPNGH